jgi:hypothetical protein
MKLLELRKSKNPEKKYDAVLDSGTGRTKTISFGAAGMDDYTKTRDEDQKRRYIARHQARESFTDPSTAGFWAKNILWNKPTIAESLRDTKARFNL